MTFRSIARGAAVASSVVLLSGYVWYRSGAGVQHSEAPPPARDSEDREIMYGSKSGGKVVHMDPQAPPPANPLFEGHAGSGDLILVDPAFSNAESDPGTAQPKAGYVFSVMSGSKSGEVRLSPPPPEQKRTMLLSGSKSERAPLLLPPSTEDAAPAAPEPTKKRRVLMSSSKSKPVTWVEVDDDKTDAPPAPQEQRREPESRP